MWNVYSYPSIVIGWQLIGVIHHNVTHPGDLARDIYHDLIAAGIDTQFVKLERVPENPEYHTYPA